MNELYKKRYEKFIKHRQENPLVKTVDGIYVEKHHIKPQSFFPEGTSQKEIDKDNTVYLTGREHFIVHCFLAKMYKQGSSKWHKTNNAMNMMNSKNKKQKGRYSNSRLYEHLKTKYYDQVNKEHEEARLIVINEICDFIDDNGKKPSPKSKIKEEKILGSKLSELKRCNETSRGIFYNSYLELAMKRGYPNLFKSKEDIRLMIIKDICDFIDKNNTYPKHRSTNKYESKLGVVLHQLRTAKNGTHGKFFDSYQDLTEARNYPNLFDVLDLESTTLQQINNICDFIDTNNRLPSKKFENEKSLYYRIHDLRKAKKDNKFLESYQKLTEKRGYPKLFTTKDLESECLEIINQICDFIDKYNKTPNSKSKNHNEKTLGLKIGSLKQAKKGKGEHRFLDSYQELVEKRGYPNLFNYKK